MRKSLGGGMRQVGILAAAGLYALDHHIDRLAEDHARAKALARAFDDVDGLTCEPPETNIVMVRVERTDVTPAEVCDRLAEHGIWILPADERRIRAVTHLHIDDDSIERAASAIRSVLS